MTKSQIHLFTIIFIPNIYNFCFFFFKTFRLLEISLWQKFQTGSHPERSPPPGCCGGNSSVAPIPGVVFISLSLSEPLLCPCRIDLECRCQQGIQALLKGVWRSFPTSLWSPGPPTSQKHVGSGPPPSSQSDDHRS